MSGDLIIPRKDLPAIAAAMYLELKVASCRCILAWGKWGYGPVTQCSLCKVIFEYESIVETSGAAR